MASKPQDGPPSQISTGDAKTPLPAWSPQAIESGLEVAPASEHDKQFVKPAHYGDKEVVAQDEKEVVAPIDLTSPLVHTSDAPHPVRQNRKLCGLRRGFFWALLVVLLLSIALGVGLGVGLGMKKSDESSDLTSAPSSASPTPTQTSTSLSEESSKVGGSLDTRYYSQSGAWNGSDVVRAVQTFPDDFEDAALSGTSETVVYYQNSSGTIQWLRETAKGTWQQPRPDDLVVLASDARNSTPITAIRLDLDQKPSWHLFYVDTKNQVRQRSGNNESTAWTEGSVGGAGLKAWDGDLVAMTVCWGANDSAPIRLLYASSNETFEEYLWRKDDDTWHWQGSWPGYNGASGVTCYRSPGDYRYMGLINTQSELEFWYQEKANTSAEWQKSNATVDNVHPISSLSFSDLAVVWQENGTNRIKVSRMTWDGENTKTTDDYSPPAQHKGVPGTRIDALSPNSVIQIFYQREGEDITSISRNLSSSLDVDWEVIPLPVDNR